MEGNRLYEYDYRPQGIIFRTWQDVMITNPDRLLYPQDRREAYYRVGDFIFTSEWSRNDARRRFHEFATQLDSENTWGTFILWLLDLSTINITREIVEINGRTGRFEVVLKPYMILSDEEMLELHFIGGRETETLSQERLNQMISDRSIVHNTRAIRPAAIAMLNIISLPIGGAVRQGATRILLPLMRRFGRRILTRLFSEAGQRTVIQLVKNKVAQKAAAFLFSLAKDTVENIVREYYTQLRNNQLRGSVDPELVQSLRLVPIIGSSFRDAFADNISGLIVDSFGSLVPEAARDGIFDPSVKERINQYVGTKMLEAMITPCADLVRAAIRAIDVNTDESTYGRRLQTEIEERFKERFSPDTLGNIVSDPVQSLLSNPNLMLR